MSGMANEMERQMREDGLDPRTPITPGAPDDGTFSGGAAPGTSEGPPASSTPTPPAGASNTDTGTGGPPDMVPYARFKEVNDRLGELRPVQDLFDLGYDADSLHRLAAFETAYLKDPVGTWKALAADIDLPQELKDALETHLSGAAQPGSANVPSGDDPKPAELPADVQARLDYVDQLRAREEQEKNEKTLSTMAQLWDELDKQDGITIPESHRQAYERTKLTYIVATGNSGVPHKTVQDFVQAARAEAMSARDVYLGGAVKTGSGGLPLAVPGSAPSPSEPPKFRNIRDATKQAEADIVAGRLPAING